MEGLHLFFGALFLVPAAYQDLRTREVPDLLSYGLLLFAIAFRMMESLLVRSWTPILQGVLGLSVGVGLGLLLFYAGQWGGADAKLLMGMGALLGLGFGTVDGTLFFILLLFSGAFYGVIYTLGLTIAHPKPFLETFRKNLSARASLRKGVIVACFLMLAALVAVGETLRLPLVALIALTYISFYLWLTVKSVEEGILLKRYSLSKLTEGDWLQEEITIRGKKVAGPGDLGVTKEQIRLIRRSGLKSVLVKEGIPFVPSFLIALILLGFLGEKLGDLVLSLL